MRAIKNVYMLLFAVLLLVSFASAQDDNTDNTPAASSAEATSRDGQSETSEAATTTASPSRASASDDGDNEITITPSASSTSSPSAATTKTAKDGAGVITDAPSATDAIPSYPSPSVPPTSAAPFMQKSNLPQGTVFICVGAIIGFALFLVLAWRVLVAWMLRRSIKRANATGYMHVKDYGPSGGAGKAPFYGQGVGSTLSLDPLTGGGRSAKGGASRASFVPQKESLFFSPTAGAGAGNNAGNRGIGYLPSGYYAAGASVAGGGVAGNGRPISMADFTGARPQSSGYQRAYTDSPRDSPALHPSDSPYARPTESPYGRLAPAGQSTASLTGRSDGRAPSAYLDDLFDLSPVPQGGHDRS